MNYILYNKACFSFVFQTGAVHTDFYHDSDFTIGAEINAWGRKFIICDCDDFTKRYYKTKYGVGMWLFSHLLLSSNTL